MISAKDNRGGLSRRDTQKIKMDVLKDQGLVKIEAELMRGRG